jgi:hypothetical protein
MPAPIYQPQLDNPGLTPLPPGQAATEGFQAQAQLGQTLVGAGQEAGQLAYRLARARDTTNEMHARADVLTGLDGLNTKYASDTDFKTAPDRFSADLQKLRGDIMAKYGAGMSPPMQANLDYFITHMGINAANTVHAASIQREAQSNVAAWGDQSQQLGQMYLRAGSDAQRASIETQGVSSIVSLKNAGWINPLEAERQTQAFRQNLQEMRLAQIMQDPNGGPQRAAALLKDDKAFPAIPAARRIDLQNQSAAAINANAQAQLSVLARTDPTAAAVAVGHAPMAAGNWSAGVVPGADSSGPVNLEALNPEVKGGLQALRQIFGQTITINSGAGGVHTGDLHPLGRAADVSIAGMDDAAKTRLIEGARAAGFTDIGIGDTHLHLGMRPGGALHVFGDSYTGPVAGRDLAAWKARLAELPGGAVTATRMQPIAPGMVDAIFERGVIPQESGGNPNIGVNAQGSIGLSQLQVGTAREAARRMGMGDVAGLPDADLAARLSSDAALNHALGLNEWRTQVARYGGNLTLAMIGYNAGPKVADAVAAQAAQKFGPAATPAQIASLAPAAETRDYIAKVYQRIGAPMDLYGMNGNAVLGARSTMIDLARQEANANDRMLSQAAALHNSDDPIVDYIQQGYAVAPARFQGWLQDQQAAAAAGDTGAAQRLRQADAAIRAAPVMAAAWAMPPSQLANAVASETQRLATTTGWTPQDAERLDVMKKVLDTTNAMKGTNPIGLAERAKIVPAVPLDFAQAGSPQFLDALAARGNQALTAARVYDGAILPFKPEDAFAGKAMLEQATPGQKAALFAQMATAFKDKPKVYDAAVSQLAGSQLERVAGQIAPSNPAAAEKLLRGEQMIQEKGVENRILKVREAVTTVYPVGMYPAAGPNSDAIQAALAMYAADKGANHALIDENDLTGIKTAIEEVTGKLAKINGAVTPLPAPFTEGGVRAALSHLTDADLKPFGGLQPGVDAAFLAGNAQLTPLSIGGSAYAVQVAGRQVKTATGQNLIVDLGQFAAAQKARLDAAEHERLVNDVKARNSGGAGWSLPSWLAPWSPANAGTDPGVGP